MHPAYFETRFSIEQPPSHWPEQFAIISAFATTGEQWLPTKNQDADSSLRARLQALQVWMHRITGFSPTNDHAEPSWGVQLGWNAACDIGEEFSQDAIYYVDQDRLWVSHCNRRRQLINVGSFRERLTLNASSN